MLDSQVVSGLDWELGFASLVKFGDHYVFGVWVETENLAVVLFCRVSELQAIHFGFGVGLLVGIDIPLAKRLDSDACHKASAVKGYAVYLKLLVIDIVCRLAFSL